MIGNNVECGVAATNAAQVVLAPSSVGPRPNLEVDMLRGRISLPYVRAVVSGNRAVRPLAVLLAVCCCLSAAIGQWPEMTTEPAPSRSIDDGFLPLSQARGGAYAGTVKGFLSAYGG